MSYTLWSLGRLVGETDLELLITAHRERRGWLIPTVVGEGLAEIAAGVSDAMNAVFYAFDLDAAAADVVAAVARREALALELHGPDGKVIPVDRLAIRDTATMMSAGAKRFDDDLTWLDCLTDDEREAFHAAIDEQVESENAVFDAEDTPEDDLVKRSSCVDVDPPRFEVIVRIVDDPEFRLRG